MARSVHCKAGRHCAEGLLKVRGNSQCSGPTFFRPAAVLGGMCTEGNHKFYKNRRNGIGKIRRGISHTVKDHRRRKVQKKRQLQTVLQEQE